MTPPVFLVDPHSVADAEVGDVIPVLGTEGHHGAAALRLQRGEQVDLVDGAGLRVTGAVDSVGPGSFDVAIESVTTDAAPRPLITVVQALAKGDRGESAVEMLTECGADRIAPWAAARSVAVWRGDKADRGTRRWRAVARAATKQSRRSRIPEVTGMVTTSAVCALLQSASLGLVLHEEAAARLSRLTLPDDGDVVVVVGPEGGITDSELTAFVECGALPVRLGESVLRTSTAGVAATALLMAASGRWG